MKKLSDVKLVVKMTILTVFIFLIGIMGRTGIPLIAQNIFSTAVLIYSISNFALE